MVKAAEKLMSLAEFLEWEDGTDTRYELVRGRLVAMAPASARHSVIVSKIGAALEAGLRRPCYVGMNAGVVRPDRDDTFYEADLVVSCTPLQADMPTIPDPSVVIEVLSPTTADHDRGGKLYDYRRVESVQAVQQAAPATGVGAVAGGVLGAVVGNQIGKGSGRTAATVLGAVGGGYVGHKVEERTRTTTVYQVAVRMEDGSLRHFQRAEPTAVGTPVVLQGKGFRVDQGGSARAADPYAQPQPGTVRVSDTY